ncbi:hypothetical protein, partial [Pandoraea sp. B-6]|uniref:hypothetical protein n=1 Tax=Pandoraea sp. B-6 TaxID=1204340 RepID=UPI001E2E1E70
RSLGEEGHRLHALHFRKQWQASPLPDRAKYYEILRSPILADPQDFDYVRWCFHRVGVMFTALRNDD